MNNPAIFKATYSNWQFIKTRQVISVSFEIPLEKENEAYEALGGMPNPAAERWFAIARLNTRKETKFEAQTQKDKRRAESQDQPSPEETLAQDQARTESEVTQHPQPDKNQPGSEAPLAPGRAPKSWHEMGYSQQAGILCSDNTFWEFLHDHFVKKGLEPVNPRDAASAAKLVRALCGVTSRSEIHPGTDAEQRWTHIVSDYRAWYYDQMRAEV